MPLELNYDLYQEYYWEELFNMIVLIVVVLDGF